MFGGDPFFGRGSMFGGGDPFARMDQMMQNFFRDPFFDTPFGHHPRVAHPTRRGPSPSIEEVPFGEHHRHQDVDRGQPIVEEPDEEAEPQEHVQRTHSQEPPHSRRRRGYHHSNDADQSLGPQFDPFGQFGGFSGSGTFFSSSSSFSSSGNGPQAVTYSSSSTTRMGPGGVFETQKTVRDGRSGQESMTLRRGLGSRERSTTKIRDGSGSINTEEVLRGITPDRTEHFDQEWQQHAQHALPNFGNGNRLSGRSRTQSGTPMFQLEDGARRNSRRMDPNDVSFAGSRYV